MAEMAPSHGAARRQCADSRLLAVTELFLLQGAGFFWAQFLGLPVLVEQVLFHLLSLNRFDAMNLLREATLANSLS